MLSRKDVRVWFWDGGAEFVGHCKMIADNGLLFHAEVKGSRDFLAVPGQLEGKKLSIELSSPKTRGEVKIEIGSADVASAAKRTISIVATFPTPPDPAFLRTLLSPTVTVVPKKGAGGAPPAGGSGPSTSPRTRGKSF
jgi:hypothetical protein